MSRTHKDSRPEIHHQDTTPSRNHDVTKTKGEKIKKTESGCDQGKNTKTLDYQIKIRYKKTTGCDLVYLH